MKIHQLCCAALLGGAAMLAHADMARLNYEEMADISGQAYYLSLGSVALPGLKTLAERHIQIGPFGISAFAQGVETRAQPLFSFSRNLFVASFNGVNTTLYGAVEAALGAAPAPYSTIGTTAWGYVPLATIKFE
ncbi:MAG: hypothetical protein AMXMBFR76_16970 [Pseudomonadota bacterium]|jgi:hypothetical protein